MKLHRLFTLFWAVFALAQTAVAQDGRYGFYFTNNQKRVHIPFQFRSNLIIVPVCLNDKDKVNFIVDTGVSHTIITDPQVFQHRPFTISRTVKLAGMGEGNAQLASISVGNSIRLGKLQIDNLPLLVLGQDVLNLSEYAGIPIHGIIGYELFANLVVTIDFQTHTLTLTRPDSYRYRPHKGERCPIYIQDNKPYTDILSIANGQESQPIRVVLDTGAGQGLLLDRFQKASATVPVPKKVVRLPLGRGLMGMIHGELGRLPKISMGHYALNDVLAAYPDSADFSLKLLKLPERQGSIGCELLRRFRVTFNYPAGYMVIKPVKRMIRMPFEHDMSGLEFHARGARLNRYFITIVAHGSPAEAAGLQVGDELLTINGISTNSLPMGAIYEMLLAGEGEPIFLIVRRHNELLTHHFSLKRLI